MTHEPLSELQPSQAGNWLLVLELDRLAWRVGAYERAIDAALARDDTAYRNAMDDFHKGSLREPGCGNASRSE
jgi:hypothetical protein